MYGFNKWDHAYTMETEEGMEYFLEDYPKLAEQRFYARDLSISDLLLDFEFAMRKALTPRQYEVITLAYKEDLIQQDVAEKLGVTQQTVQEHVRKAIKNLATYHMLHKRKSGENE